VTCGKKKKKGRGKAKPRSGYGKEKERKEEGRRSEFDPLRYRKVRRREKEKGCREQGEEVG